MMAVIRRGRTMCAFLLLRGHFELRDGARRASRGQKTYTIKVIKDQKEEVRKRDKAYLG